MAIFEASKGYHLSEDGLDPWAHFTRVKDSWPPVFRFETDDPRVIDRVKTVDGVTRIDTPTTAGA